MLKTIQYGIVGTVDPTQCLLQCVHLPAYLVRSDHDGMKLQHFVTEGLSIYALETGPTSTSLSLVP